MKSLMQTAFLEAFDEQIVELRGRLPRLTGESRREVVAELESLTEFLALIRNGRKRPLARSPHVELGGATEA